MGSVYKKKYTKALPEGAETFMRKGERFARWRDRHGKSRTAPLTEGSDGTLRLLMEAGTYTAKYRDASGKVVEVATGCRSKDAARAVLGELMERAEKVKTNIISSAENAILDHQEVPLSRHIADYVAHLRAKRSSTGHCEARKFYLDKIAEKCGFQRLRDLDRSALERWLASEADKGASARTHNAYRAAAVGFGNWCVFNRRLASNPFTGLCKANEKADPRRKRRALTEEELQRLLQAARRRPLQECLTIRRGKNAGKARANVSDKTRARLERVGWERALIYKTLVLTGLRKGELASITVGQVWLEGNAPFLQLDAADEKNRQGSHIPLRADLAADISEWLAEKLRTEREEALRKGEPVPDRLPGGLKLFNVPAGLIRILDRDLVAAEIPKRDERGRTIDVHALRHTFGTHLSKAGVPLRTAQAAMRHSDPRLTANVYTDPKLLDVAGALNQLPALDLEESADAPAEARKIGAGWGARTLAPVLAPNSGNRCTQGSFPGKTEVGDTVWGGQGVAEEKGPVYKGFQRLSKLGKDKKMARPVRFERTTSCSGGKHSIP